MAAPLPLALVALGALSLLVGCGDDGGEDGGAATGAEADACASMAESMLLPLDTEGDQVSDAALPATMEVLAGSGPAEVRGPAEAVLALEEMGELTDEEVMALSAEEQDRLVAEAQEGDAALDEIYLWGLDHCEVDGVLWACAVPGGRSRFTKIPMEGEPPATTEPGAATPEALYAEADRDGEPIEVRRADDRVLVAWVDDAGHAVESLELADEDGWRVDGQLACEEPGDRADGFEPVGEEVEG